MPATKPAYAPRAPHEYIQVRHIGDGEYAVLGSRTLLAVEPWTYLKTISAAALDQLPPHIEVIDLTAKGAR